MRRGIILVASLATLCSSGASPVRALPIEPPSVQLSNQASTSLDAVLYATASDPDGSLTMLELCVEGVCTPATLTADDPVATCVSGDQEQLQVPHRFPAYGEYEVTVRATGGSCLDLLQPETVERTFRFVVHEILPPPPAPPIEIACAAPGARTATDTGVTEDAITLAHVTPVAPSFQDHGALGVAAAVASINAGGGICGRQLVLLTGGEFEFQGDRGIREAVAADPFALVGLHLSELDDTREEIETAQIPVVGTGGRAQADTASPWIWSIGASGATFADIVVDEAFEQGGRTFAIVHETLDPHAVRIADAIEAEVATHEGASVTIRQGLRSNAASYSSEIQTFNQACGAGCDVVVPLLTPWTLLTWLAGRPRDSTVRTSLWPDLSGEDLARDCGDRCQDALVWLPFRAPIGEPSDDTELFTNSVRSQDPTADVLQHRILLGFEAMLVAAHAMGQVGVELTRDALQDVLDATSFTPGLTAGPMSWAAARDPNRSMRGYRIVVGQGSFMGFTDETGWRTAD